MQFPFLSFKDQGSKAGTTAVDPKI